MSLLQFSDTTTKQGVVQLLEKLTKSKTSASSYSLEEKTRDINTTLAWFWLLALKANGKIQLDDTNQTDYPIIRMDLVSGQGDYAFSIDGSVVPNQILNILRVECANAQGKFSTLEKFDMSDEIESLNYLRSLSGQPYRYDELGGALWLDPKPNFSYAAGMEVTIGRGASYFVTTDTTKKPGIPEMFHEYLAYRPAYLYAVTYLPNLAPGYLKIVEKIEKEIGIYYASRNAREHRKIGTKPIRFR